MIQFLYWLLLLGTPGHTQEVMHQTVSGKYPIYYAAVQGQDDSWTQDMQREYDWKMADTIQKWCVDKVSLALSEQSLANQSEAGKVQLSIRIASFKEEMTNLSATVAKGTHKNVEEWGCP